MNSYDVEFITELFLDNDSTSTINRLAVTVSNIIYENNENVNAFNEVIKKEFSNVLQSVEEHSIDEYNSKHRFKHRKKRGFYEETVKNFSNEDYVSHFKMKKSTAEALIKYLHENVILGSTGQLDKKVHIFLYILTTDLSYNEVAALFGLQKSSVSCIFYDIAAMLSEQRYYFINWPSLEEQHVTRLMVNSSFKFPNCVGFIDACRFTVGSKRSKKSCLAAVLLQAVCDESLMFIDIHIGSIGKTKKYKVFKESKLSHELKNFVDFDNHILGDSDYKLKNNLLTPFSSEELLTSEEMKFNEIHWKTRSYIGHVFEMFKERFRKLNHLDSNNPMAVETVLSAACMLHNFILLHEGRPGIKEETIATDDCTSGITMNIDTNIVKSPEEKRQFICNYINYMIVNNVIEEES